jgi:hypothetical protein
MAESALSPTDVVARRARSQAQAAARARHFGADDPRTVAARREFAAASIEEAVEKYLAAAPQLSDEQVERLAALLRGGAR